MANAAADWRDEAIAAALARAHIPSLVNALVHVTGDAAPIRGRVRPTVQPFGDPQGGIGAADQAAVRARARIALAAYRDAGRPALPAPAPALVQEMVDFIVGAELDADHGELAAAELRLFDEDPFQVPFDDLPAAARRDFHVVVVGAGMSGLLAAVRLQQAGVRYTVVEKNADVGGVWYRNRYPGCRVDSPNHAYAYSFAPRDWPQRFSRRDALLDYFDRIAADHGLRPSIRFDTEALDARYRGAGAWRVRVRGPGGEETLDANAVVVAVGQLGRPKLPDIEGVGAFAGPAFHTAEWEGECDLADRRVVVVGTGASAFQAVPEIARTARRVAVCQRTPPWVLPQPEYRDDVAAGERWLLDNVPFYGKWFRFATRWAAGEGLLSMARRDPAWRGRGSVSAANDRLRALLTARAERMLGDDPQLLARCVPDYPPAGKRMLVDDGSWFRALRRDNVELVTDPVVRVDAGGVELASGRRLDADVLVYATGFHANRMLAPMRIHGRGGVELRAHWGDDPRAYLGIVAPGWPNLFFCYGPNTNLVVNGSIVFPAECEVRYIMACLRLLIENGRAAMDCRRDVCDAYNAMIDAGNRDMAWGAPGVASWYRNERGRVTQNWPFTLLEFWSRTRAPNPRDFAFA